MKELINKKNVIDGIELMHKIPENSIKTCFFDPQYKSVLKKMAYGNEGVSRGKARCGLPQMTDDVIINFIKEIDSVLLPSGHLFLWIDKFILCEGTIKEWIVGSELEIVDLITLDKQKMNMGYRSRRCSEYLMVLQKLPKRAKGCWALHNIRDAWSEKIFDKIHTHQKPFGLIEQLILSTTNENDLILDPCAGSFVVFDACKKLNRNFIGTDLQL